jgi:hypothetical protein
MALTSKQRRLRKEIEEIASLINMDHWNIDAYDPPVRTTFLELMKNNLVRSHVIINYTLIDEFLTDIICHYYFRKPKAGYSYKELWRNKKFRIFCQNLMDEIYLPKKLGIVREINDVPKNVSSIIMRINDLRNALAHSFFPENRRQYASHKKVLYSGLDIFSKQGIEKFQEDFGVVREYLHERAFGGP